MTRRELTPFGQWLLEECKSRGITQSDLSLTAGLNRSTVSLIARGYQRPRVTTCLALAGALDLPPEYVLRQAGLMSIETGAPVVPPELRDLVDEIQALPVARRKLVLAAWRATLDAVTAEPAAEA